MIMHLINSRDLAAAPLVLRTVRRTVRGSVRSPVRRTNERTYRLTHRRTQGSVRRAVRPLTELLLNGHQSVSPSFQY
jgi:hypothetical protein